MHGLYACIEGIEVKVGVLSNKKKRSKLTLEKTTTESTSSDGIIEFPKLASKMRRRKGSQARC